MNLNPGESKDLSGEADSSATGLMLVRVCNGIGNRVSGMVAAFAVSELLGARLEIIWERHGECGALFHELFEGFGAGNIVVSDSSSEDGEWVDASTLSGRQIQERLSAAGKVRLKAYSSFGFDLAPKDEFFELMNRQLRNLRPIPLVLGLIGSVPRPGIGMHMRVTNHIPCKIATPHWCYRSALRCVAKVFPDTAVFVCADKPSVLAKLAAESPAAVVHLPSRPEPEGDAAAELQKVRFALADLWLFSACPITLASRWSTFAYIGSQMGGSRLYYLVGAPPFLTSKMIGVRSWWIYKRVRYDGARDSWEPRLENRNALGKIQAWVAFAIARIFFSTAYQEFGDPISRFLFRRRLIVFLKENRRNSS
jgi:hypothetical protein